MRLALSPEGQIFALLATNRTITIADLASGRALWQLSNKPTPFSAMTFAPRAPILATGDLRGRVQLWDLRARQELRQLSGHTNSIHSDRLGFYKRWDTATGLETTSGEIWEAPYNLPVVDFSPEHRRLAFSGGSRLYLIALGVTNDLVAFPHQRENIRSVAFSPDGRWSATGGEDGTTRLWDCATGRELAVLRAHRLGVLAVAFSSDGRRLATGGGEGVVKLWDNDTLQEVLTLAAPWATEQSPWIMSLGFSADGSYLWASDPHLRWQLWRAPAFEEIAGAEAK